GSTSVGYTVLRSSARGDGFPLFRAAPPDTPRCVRTTRWHRRVCRSFLHFPSHTAFRSRFRRPCAPIPSHRDTPTERRRTSTRRRATPRSPRTATADTVPRDATCAGKSYGQHIRSACVTCRVQPLLAP